MANQGTTRRYFNLALLMLEVLSFAPQPLRHILPMGELWKMVFLMAAAAILVLCFMNGLLDGRVVSWGAVAVAILMTAFWLVAGISIGNGDRMPGSSSEFLIVQALRNSIYLFPIWAVVQLSQAMLGIIYVGAGQRLGLR